MVSSKKFLLVGEKYIRWADVLPRGKSERASVRYDLEDVSLVAGGDDGRDLSRGYELQHNEKGEKEHCKGFGNVRLIRLKCCTFYTGEK
jgi:hypothetical protein